MVYTVRVNTMHVLLRVVSTKLPGFFGLLYDGKKGFLQNITSSFPESLSLSLMGLISRTVINHLSHFKAVFSYF